MGKEKKRIRNDPNQGLISFAKSKEGTAPHIENKGSEKRPRIRRTLGGEELLGGSSEPFGMSKQNQAGRNRSIREMGRKGERKKRDYSGREWPRGGELWGGGFW